MSDLCWLSEGFVSDILDESRIRNANCTNRLDEEQAAKEKNNPRCNNREVENATMNCTNENEFKPIRVQNQASSNLAGQRCFGCKSRL